MEPSAKKIQKTIGSKEKIALGIVFIITCPLSGTLLFRLYTNFIGIFLSKDIAVFMFWFCCILTMAILGIATVLIGCNEKAIEHGCNINK